MVGADRVTMSGKELQRVQVIRQVMDKQLTQVKAGASLGLTTRQVRRLLKRVQAEGAAGLVHRGRGRASNRRIPEKVKVKVLRLYRTQYGDFGPTLTAEKLAERHRCVQMAYVDNASSRVFARFYKYEGTIPAMDSFHRYFRQQGIPLAIYADKHTTYQSPAEPTVAEQLAGEDPQSQFGRALHELVVELIPAHSPQAKGRVERLVKAFQDRLVKELRLARIASLKAANRFLEGYLPVYNRRFAVRPTQAADLHRPPPHGRELAAILCLKTTRCLRNDFTIAHQGQLYQIHDTVRATYVQVEERLDGTLQLTHQGRRLAYHIIAARPRKQRGEGTPLPSPRRPLRPRLDHPWRRRLLPERGQRAGTATP